MSRVVQTVLRRERITHSPFSVLYVLVCASIIDKPACKHTKINLSLPTFWMDGIIFSLEYTTHYYRHKDNMHIFMRDLAAALLWDSISQWSLFLPRCGSLNWAVIGGKKCAMIQISALIKRAVRYDAGSCLLSVSLTVCLFICVTQMPTHVHLSPQSYFCPFWRGGGWSLELHVRSSSALLPI